MNKFKSKNLKVIFLMIMLISISVFTVVFQELKYGYDISQIWHSWILNKDNRAYARNVYESSNIEGRFLQEELLQNIVIATSKEGYYDKSDIEQAKLSLDIFSDIKIFAKNNNTNTIYTNTKYKSNSEFKKNQVDYCNIEIDLNNKSIYSRTIDGDKGSTSIDKEAFWGIYKNDKDKNPNFTINITFPKEPLGEEGVSNFNGSLPYVYKDFNRSRKSVDILGITMIATFITSIVAGICYIKNKNKLINSNNLFYKIYNNIHIELNIIIILILYVKSRIYGDYGMSLNFKIKDILIYSLIKFAFLFILFMFIINYLNLDNKKDIFKNSILFKIYKIIFSSCKNIVKKQKQIPLIRRLIIINLIIIIVSGFITITLYTNWYWQDPLLVLVIINIMIVSILIIVTSCIIKKLLYLDNIIIGTERIKNGEVDYKIDIRGNDNFTIFAENINNISEGLDNAIDEKLKSERMKSELITNVSHDLKTPLTAIINYVGLIKKEENIQPEYINDYVNILDSKSKRLKILIDDLFEASKASSGNIQLNIEKLDLGQLLRQSIGENEEKLVNSNLELRISIPNEPVYINCDGKRMYRVFENLLTNIAKYSLENTRVYINIKENDGQVYVSMKNISAYELDFEAEEIIERFRRGDLSRNTEGSGLGLSIARDLVELQGGKFNIQVDGDLFKVEITW